MVEGVLARDAPGGRADDHAELDLEVEGVRPGRADDRGAVRDDRVGELGEEDRANRRRPPALRHVIAVVQPDADDLAGELDGRERGQVRTFLAGGRVLSDARSHRPDLFEQGRQPVLGEGEVETAAAGLELEDAAGGREQPDGGPVVGEERDEAHARRPRQLAAGVADGAGDVVGAVLGAVLGAVVGAGLADASGVPVGPVLAPREAIPDPQRLRLRSWRTPGAGPDAGRPILMQDGSTADMIWGVAELLEFITAAITLDPGDIVVTGTPSGVGVFRDPPVFLEPGDRVRCEIEGIGSVENPVIDWNDDYA